MAAQHDESECFIPSKHRLIRIGYISPESYRLHPPVKMSATGCLAAKHADVINQQQQMSCKRPTPRILARCLRLHNSRFYVPSISTFSPSLRLLLPPSIPHVSSAPSVSIPIYPRS